MVGNFGVAEINHMARKDHMLHKVENDAGSSCFPQGVVLCSILHAADSGVQDMIICLMFAFKLRVATEVLKECFTPA